MRVIAGEFRSRVLKTLPGLNTRPTPDRLREALFNILALRLEGAEFLDAYAGTGAVGIEALSRGARRAIFVESNRAAVDIIRQNLASLDLHKRSEVITSKALPALKRLSADIIFLDPPYELESEYAAALTVAQAPLVLVQHASRFALEEEYGRLRRVRSLKQGDNSIGFYESVEPTP
jgi:16S rRNA (guanine966-N2)-methyltransferase